MDIISLAVTQALFYASASWNYTDAPTINWTALDTDAWWGPGAKTTVATTIVPANITYKPSMIADLKERLNTSLTTNFTQPLEGTTFNYGFNSVNVKNWTNFWLNEYNFTEREKNWNKFPMFRTNIQGIDLFYLRITPEVSNGTELIPMLMLHGWPGSIMEFWDCIPLLTAVNSTRDFAIDLIVPSMPGFGFSSPAARPGMGPAEIAIIMRNLMKRIGFKKWYVQGGDFGALVNGHMATLFPEEVLGYHTNWGVLLSPVALFLHMVGQIYPPMIVEESLYSRMYPLTGRFQALMTATGYMHIQATRTDTIAVPLTDSPISLLAYLFEKYATANNKTNIGLVTGGLSDYNPNFLIDTLMHYWSTHSINSAMRLYSEAFTSRHAKMRLEEIPTFVPTWIIQPGQEFTFQSPVILSLRYKNIINVTAVNVGGHFFAEGEPVVFSESVLTALNAFRKWHKKNGTDTTTS